MNTKEWLWLAAGGLVAYWLYTNYQANQAAQVTNSSTGVPKTPNSALPLTPMF